MKQLMSVVLTVIILFLVGCNNDKSVIEEHQNQLKELENEIAELKGIVKEQEKTINDQNKEFSYLNDLTKEEVELYEQFTQDKNPQHLLGISPEKILLVYYHSVVIGDVEAIYSLIYDDGTLPDLSTFRQKYYKEGLYNSEQESTVDFRYYNSIKVREDNKKENEVVVEMNVSLGIFQSTIVYMLKKQNDIWKIDILHLMENFEEKKESASL
ncbi:hypothetical protein IM538_14160 [Cytobacillus suaedae]|nr:hypothetical protein IM538_14160 [Cytobacillus suaedae]